jgi:DNA-binding response OmpR family regulator
VKGYGYGADDYIAKPFSPKELVLKIEASLKRREELTRQVRGKHPYLIEDSDLKRLMLHGNILSLTPSEYLILSTLVSTPTKLFSRAELSQLIYDNNLGMIDEQSIDSHIYHIRKKLRVYHSEELVQTIRGMGYTLA